jgi:hypothetical protein
LGSEEKSGDRGRAGEREFDGRDNTDDLHQSPPLASVSPNVGAEWGSLSGSSYDLEAGNRGFNQFRDF